MFGIKSNKDKEIEKLKKEIKTLKAMEITPTITHRKLDTNAYMSEFVIPIEALNSISEKNNKKCTSY